MNMQPSIGRWNDSALAGTPRSILIITDAWQPQVNGVVRTLSTTCGVLRGWGHEVTVISPLDYMSVPAPRYPQAMFMGARTGSDLAGFYAGADCFVFPSVTDTFGLVMIEALACGTPVAAFPAAGPIDILTPKVGAMLENLDEAIELALLKKRDDCVVYAAGFSWEAATQQFLSGLVALEPCHDALVHAVTAL